MTASRGDSLETAEGDLAPVDPLSGLADRDFFDAQLAAALADPAVRERLAQLGLEPPPADQQAPEALGAFHKAEVDKWWPLIKAANIKGE